MKKLRPFLLSLPLLLCFLYFLYFLYFPLYSPPPRVPAPNPPPSPGAHSAQAAPRRQSPLLSATTAAIPSHPAGLNAADVYKNAFALFNALTDEEKQMLAKPRDEIDADKAAQLFKKIQPIMELLRQAKDAAYCDWAMGPLSFSTPLPQMNLVMKLGQVAQWSAGYQFLSSDPEPAVSDLATLSSLGQSVGNQALIGFLVDASVNQMAVNMVRENAAGLSPEATVQALEMFRAQEWNRDIKAAVEAESDLVATLAEQFSDAQSGDQALKKLNTLLQTSGSTELADSDAASIQAQNQWYQQVLKDYASKVFAPDAEFNAWWADIPKQAVGSPLAAMALPSLNRTRNGYQAAVVNNSMIQAGLLILQNGPDQLALQPDPTTGKPFTYVQTATGFQLSSTFQSKGKPLTMSFATAQK